MTAVDWQALLAHPDVVALLELALREDLGAGDLTTEAIFPTPRRARAALVARTPTVVCGLALARALFQRLDPKLEFRAEVGDGERVEAGVLAVVEADLRALLTAERSVLNFMMHLCAVAHAAQRAVEAVPAGCRAKIYDTRKTTPGFRRLDKAAVACGGAMNHRMGLFDAVLIKDNHVAAAGSVSRAVGLARAHVADRTPRPQVEVEVDTLDQLDEALAAAPDVILLDNFSLPAMRAAVTRVAGRIPLEVSGGVTLATIPDIARTGVDRISLGALTHTIVPADLALDLEPGSR